MPSSDPIVDQHETLVANGSDGFLDFEVARFLNLTVHAMTMEDMHAAIARGITSRQKWLIANHNLHSVYLSYRQKRQNKSGLAGYYGLAKWTHIDGMSIVLLARAFGHKIQRAHRIAYNYSLPWLMRLAEKQGWRVFYLGSSAAVSNAGRRYFHEHFPNLVVEMQHGYFAKERAGSDNQAVLLQIRTFRPHILFVGMGMPIQEEWIAENYSELDANIILASGATLDYFVAALPLPPAWIGKAGLEWAYRLLNEPRRLGFRYLVEPWFVLLAIAEHLIDKIWQRVTMR